MTRRLTTSEALEFLEAGFNVAPEAITTGIVEAFIAGIDATQVRTDLESYIADLTDDIDTASIWITPDQCEDSGMDAAHIIIKTQGEAA